MDSGTMSRCQIQTSSLFMLWQNSKREISKDERSSIDGADTDLNVLCNISFNDYCSSMSNQRQKTTIATTDSRQYNTKPTNSTSSGNPSLNKVLPLLMLLTLLLLDEYHYNHTIHILSNQQQPSLSSLLPHVFCHAKKSSSSTTSATMATTRSSSSSRRSSSTSRLSSSSSLSSSKEQKKQQHKKEDSSNSSSKPSKSSTNYGRSTGTRTSGVGSHSLRNRSIFLSPISSSSYQYTHSNRHRRSHRHHHDTKHDGNDTQYNPMRGRMHAKLTREGQLLLKFSSSSASILKRRQLYEVPEDEEKSKENKNEENIIISLSTIWQQRRDETMIDNVVGGKSGDGPMALSPFIHAEVFGLHPETVQSKSSASSSNERSSFSSKSKLKKRRSKTTTTASSSTSSVAGSSSPLSEEWIPLEGIYGIYTLPSGPHLLLITDSESIYSSSSSSLDPLSKQKEHMQKTNTNPPLLNLRRIKSVEIVPIPPSLSPTTTSSGGGGKSYSSGKHTPLTPIQAKVQDRQLQLLRKSFKEHNLYYVPPPFSMSPLLKNGKEDKSCVVDDNDCDGGVVVRDVTHTLQRSFVHWEAARQRRSRLQEQHSQVEDGKGGDAGSLLDYNDDDGEIILGANETIIGQLGEKVDEEDDDIMSMNEADNGVVDGDISCSHGKKSTTTKTTLSKSGTKSDEKGSWWSSFRSLAATTSTTSNINSTQNLIVGTKEGAIGNSTANNIEGNSAIMEGILPSMENAVTNTSGGVEMDGDDNSGEEYLSWWFSLLPLYTTVDGNKFNHHPLRPDSRFFWNEESINPLIQPLLLASSSNPVDESTNHDRPIATAMIRHDFQLPYGVLLDYTIPVTSAFVGVQRDIPLVPNATTTVPSTAPFADVTYDEILISRRSKFRAGTRFTRRGSDGTGAVANYAETEQIIIVRKKNSDGNDKEVGASQAWQEEEVYSHVQTRGSIPLRWSSPSDVKTYRPRILIGTDPLAQARALRSHLFEQLSLYSTLSMDEGTIVAGDGDDDEEGGDNEKEKISRKSRINHSKLVFVNLIDKHSDQGRLGRAFDAVLKAVMEVYSQSENDMSNASTYVDRDDNFVKSEQNKQLKAPIVIGSEAVRHVWFDFHAECKKGRWDRLGKLLDDVSPALDKQGYFCAVSSRSNDPRQSPWGIRSLQNGIVRTNCMDCLDRTNVVQSVFGRYMLYRHFSERIGLQNNISPISSSSNTLSSFSQRHVVKRRLPLEYVVGFKRQTLRLPWASGEVSHRLLWADNADAISRLYAGTPALKGDFTRTGKRTRRGALDDGMNSLQRYYLNNFIDADRQEGMDLLVGFSKFAFTDGEDDLNSDIAFDRDNLGSDLTIKDAARKIILDGSSDNGKIKMDSLQHFSRIKVKKKERVRSIPRLDLTWVQGDLQGQVRSAALSSYSSDTSADSSQFSPDFSVAGALRDIERRGSSDSPWWVVESSDDNIDDVDRDKPERKKSNNGGASRDSFPSQPSTIISANGSHIFGSLIAAAKAPLATAIAVVCVMLPGLVATSTGDK